MYDLEDWRRYTVTGHRAVVRFMLIFAGVYTNRVQYEKEMTCDSSGASLGRAQASARCVGS